MIKTFCAYSVQFPKPPEIYEKPFEAVKISRCQHGVIGKSEILPQVFIRPGSFIRINRKRRVFSTGDSGKTAYKFHNSQMFPVPRTQIKKHAIVKNREIAILTAGQHILCQKITSGDRRSGTGTFHGFRYTVKNPFIAYRFPLLISFHKNITLFPKSFPENSSGFPGFISRSASFKHPVNSVQPFSFLKLGTMCCYLQTKIRAFPFY